ncbi:MAG: hypothetical protein JW940_01385 [Polyangiaceae bacterium]|nr:hypothetical protein [Polyangiaceae bacterium]
MNRARLLERIVMLVLGALCPATLVSCQDQAYCFNCGGPRAGEGGSADTGEGTGGRPALSSSAGASSDGEYGSSDTDCDANTRNDPFNCGKCGRVCRSPHGMIASCNNGICSFECASGRWDNDKDVDGCEYSCTQTNGGVEKCDGLDNDCDGRVDEDISKKTLENCGACGTPCSIPGARFTCEKGSCELVECLGGFHDIDRKRANGCEYRCAPTNGGVEVCDGLDNDCNGKIDDDIDTSSDPLNCGECGVRCAGGFPNAESVCRKGQCVMGVCSAGYTDKDANPKNGCEYNCDSSCVFPFAEPECDDDGTCTMGECLAGYWNTDGDPDNGCEYPCAPTHGGVEACDGLDNDCNGEIDDDVDTSSDPAHCGACGTSCIGRFPNAEPSCVDGECALGDCVAGYSNQDGDVDNGCEYSCSATCSFPFATALCDDDGSCHMGDCLPGYWDIDEDPDNGCEYPCAPTHDGVEACDGIDNDCNHLIDDGVDTSSDPLNCGGCGQSCVGRYDNAEPTCFDGECVRGPCLDGYLDLDGDPDNGCEFSCDATCAVPFAVSSCAQDGSCLMGECLVGYRNNDGDPDNGCEYPCSETNGGVEECDGLDNDCDGDVDEDFDLDTSVEHCGGCYVGCAAYFPGAVTVCNEGVCEPTGCLPDYANADGNLLNGCEYLCSPTNGGVETCDGLDNDCNGVKDDEPLGGFDPPLPEQCPPPVNPSAPCESRTLCVNGEAACVQVTGPSREVCDGIDNDCDGDVDEDTPEDPLPQVGKPCGETQVGPCEFGMTVCSGSSGISCEGEIDPADTETCNGIDDDCNGVVDDDPEGQGQPCWLGDGHGACVNGGVQQCMGLSGLVCSGATAPEDEICDGPAGTTAPQYDNDCDTQVNEGCLYPAASAVRLDTNGSTQTHDSTFHLAATSYGDRFLVVYSDLRTGSGDIYGRASTDAGQTWGTNDIRMSSDGAVEVEPSPMLTANRGYVAYSRFNSSHVRRIYLRRADSPYTNWGNTVEIDGSPASSVDCYSPRGTIAYAGGSASGDRLAVVWSEIAGTATDPTRNIRLSYSKNGGANWSAPILVNQEAGQDKGELPVIDSDGASMVYVAWRDKRTPGVAQAYFARIDLSQGTPTLGSANALQPAVSGASAERIAMSAAGQNVYVAWTDLRDEARAIRVAYSHDRGQTWSTVAGVTDGLVVNTDSTFADASDPALDARDDRVVVAWADTRSGKGDIRLNRSDDAGATWLSDCPRVDTGDTLGSASSLLPAVALGSGDYVFVTWQDLRFPRSAVVANVSMNAGDVFHADAGGAYRMDSDLLSPGADSQSPLVLAGSTVSRAAVTWIDFQASDGTNASKGDVYARTIE